MKSSADVLSNLRWVKELADKTRALFQRFDEIKHGKLSYFPLKFFSDPLSYYRNLQEPAVTTHHEGGTGQTTVNKKAPIHYIISINDKFYRPL